MKNWPQAKNEMFLDKNKHIIWTRLVAGLLVAVAFAVLGFAGLDEFLQPWFQKLNWAGWEWLAVLGSWKVIAGASLAFFVIAKILWRGSKSGKLSANIFCSVIIAEFAVGLLKLAHLRFRPDMSDALSFPSGHSAAAFAMLVSVGLMYPKTKIFVWPLAIVAASARVSIGAHWASDAAFAAFLGMAAADIVAVMRQKLSRAA
jgi:membrane-associated phospholipid phosphatase